MRKIIGLVCIVAPLAFAAPAAPFSIIHPITGDCRQVLVPGDSFPGNWEVVSNTPAALPGPWNGHGHANDKSPHGPVVCPD